MAAPKGKREESKQEGVVNMVEAGKAKALETTLANLNKKYGEGVVMKLGDATKLNVESIPSGSLSLDIESQPGGRGHSHVHRAADQAVGCARNAAGARPAHGRRPGVCRRSDAGARPDRAE